MLAWSDNRMTSSVIYPINFAFASPLRHYETMNFDLLEKHRKDPIFTILY